MFGDHHNICWNPQLLNKNKLFNPHKSASYALQNNRTATNYIYTRPRLAYGAVNTTSTVWHTNKPAAQGHSSNSIAEIYKPGGKISIKPKIDYSDKTWVRPSSNLPSTSKQPDFKASSTKQLSVVADAPKAKSGFVSQTKLIRNNYVSKKDIPKGLLKDDTALGHLKIANTTSKSAEDVKKWLSADAEPSAPFNHSSVLKKTISHSNLISPNSGRVGIVNISLTKSSHNNIRFSTNSSHKAFVNKTWVNPSHNCQPVNHNANLSAVSKPVLNHSLGLQSSAGLFVKKDSPETRVKVPVSSAYRFTRVKTTSPTPSAESECNPAKRYKPSNSPLNSLSAKFVVNRSPYKTINNSSRANHLYSDNNKHLMWKGNNDLKQENATLQPSAHSSHNEILRNFKPEAHISGGDVLPQMVPSQDKFAVDSNQGLLNGEKSTKSSDSIVEKMGDINQDKFPLNVISEKGAVARRPRSATKINSKRKYAEKKLLLRATLALLSTRYKLVKRAVQQQTLNRQQQALHKKQQQLAFQRQKQQQINSTRFLTKARREQNNFSSRLARNTYDHRHSIRQHQHNVAYPAKAHYSVKAHPRSRNSQNQMRNVVRTKYKLIRTPTLVSRHSKLALDLRPVSKRKHRVVFNKCFKYVAKYDDSKGSSESYQHPNTNVVYAQRAVHRSIAQVTQLRRARPQKRYCVFYQRFGKCRRGDRCPYLHDPARVAVCTRFLRGTCRLVTCPFLHRAAKEKVPVCSFFLRAGACTRDNCPYLHVNVGKDAEICSDFVSGFCALAERCKKRHILWCPDRDENGRCPRGAKCPLKHQTLTNARKIQSSSCEAPPKKKARIEEISSDDITLPMKERKLAPYMAFHTTQANVPAPPDPRPTTSSSSGYQLLILPRLGIKQLAAKK